MSYVYTETMLFLDDEEGEAEGWTTDCGGKKDYDPHIVYLSSRVYRDGSYISSICLGGGTELLTTGVLRAETAVQARAEVERWSVEQADKIIAAVKAAYATPPQTEDIRP